jgi:hypothetical protein
MREYKNEYQVIRDLLKTMGYTTTFGANQFEICFQTEGNGFVYLTFTHKYELCQALYQSPAVAVRIANARLRIRAERVPSGDCMLEFSSMCKTFQVMSLERVTEERVEDFNRNIRKVAA